MEDYKPAPSVSLSDKFQLKKIALVAAFIAVFIGGWLVGDGRVQIAGLQELDSVISDATSSPQSGISTEGVDEIYNLLQQKYDGELNSEELSLGLKQGLVAAVGDTYTEYLSPEATQEFNSTLEGTFEGIGAELSREGSFVIIVSPIKGFPAEKAGLQPRDIIIEIDDEPATDITVSEAVKRIRGEKGTDVKLSIVRDGEQLDFTIIRDTIDIPSVEWRVEDGVGIIEVSRFGDDTAKLVSQAAEEFKSQNITKVILDMRGNPGGLLNQSIDVSEIWLEKGSTILEEKRGDEVIQSFKSERNPILNDVDTIVLINEGSASASEIVAGALKDNNKAQLYGAKSFGKGSVQQLIDLKSGGALKVTIARWFTPAGKNIDKEGIEPDVAIEVSQEDIEQDRDPQFEAAKNALLQ